MRLQRSKNGLRAMLVIGLLSSSAFALTMAVGGGTQTVKPDNSHTNGDGVTIDNDVASDGLATISPKNGKATSATTVKGKTGLKGEITGIDGNDTVSLSYGVGGNGCSLVVAGTGGKVKINGGSYVRVCNTSEDADIMVCFSSGEKPVNVEPGDWTDFDTSDQ